MLVFSFLVLAFDVLADAEVGLEGTHHDHVPLSLAAGTTSMRREG
jgi:hypothetical protein